MLLDLCMHFLCTCGSPLIYSQFPQGTVSAHEQDHTLSAVSRALPRSGHKLSQWTSAGLSPLDRCQAEGSRFAPGCPGFGKRFCQRALRCVI